jgi:hypothetical protein
MSDARDDRGVVYDDGEQNRRDLPDDFVPGVTDEPEVVGNVPVEREGRAARRRPGRDD